MGSSFAFAAYGALVEAARELQEAGTYGYLERARVGYYEGAHEAFSGQTLIDALLEPRARPLDLSGLGAR